MTQQEIQERNKQIALMLGYKMTWFDTAFYTWKCRFLYDWNILMEAVELIKKTSGIAMVDGPFRKPTCVIHLSNLRAVSGQSNTLKEAVFIAVSDFAKLYNNKEL
jgi:hypothetical protein